MRHEHKGREVLEEESEWEHGGPRLAHSNCETAPQVTGLRAGLSMAHAVNHRLHRVDLLIFEVLESTRSSSPM